MPVQSAYQEPLVITMCSFVLAIRIIGEQPAAKFQILRLINPSQEKALKDGRPLHVLLSPIRTGLKDSIALEKSLIQEWQVWGMYAISHYGHIKVHYMFNKHIIGDPINWGGA